MSLNHDVIWAMRAYINVFVTLVVRVRIVIAFDPIHIENKPVSETGVEAGTIAWE